MVALGSTALSKETGMGTMHLDEAGQRSVAEPELQPRKGVGT